MTLVYVFPSTVQVYVSPLAMGVSTPSTPHLYVYMAGSKVSANLNGRTNVVRDTNVLPSHRRQESPPSTWTHSFNDVSLVLKSALTQSAALEDGAIRSR